MNFLCLNTCFNETYLALEVNQKNIYKSMDSSLKQSENVLSIIEEAFVQANISFKDLDYVSCVVGPGSFTGIRIGASLLKGACFPYPKIKKIEINSLDLLAYTYSKINTNKQNFWVLLNALSGNYFARKYNFDGTAIGDPLLLKTEQVTNISGDIVGLKQENLDVCNKYVNFSCEVLLDYTKQMYSEGKFSNDFIPLYIRKSQAEVELERKHGNN